MIRQDRHPVSRSGRRPHASTSPTGIEALFPVLVEQSLVGIYLVRGGRFVYVNPKLAEVFGYTQSEVLELPSILELVDERDHALVRENLRKRIEGEIEDLHYTFRGRRQDDSTLVAEVHGTRTMLGGRPAVIGTLLDITERQQAEEELRESEERYRLMVEGSEQVFFFVHDLGGRFEYLSPSTRQVIGYAPRDLMGRSYEEILEGASSRVRSLTERALLRGERQPPYRAEVQHRDGRRMVVEIVETPRVRDGTVIGMCGFAKDITARVEAEEERERLYREARAAVRARDEMLAVVSHDLRSPLNTVRMAAVLLGESRADEERVSRTTDMIERAVAQMDALIEDLLDVSRMEAGSLQVEPEPMDPVSLLQDAKRLVEAAAESEGIGIDLTLSDGLPDVLADRRRVIQVLTNLLTNAVKFTPPGGEVALRGDREADVVRITVADTGGGIPPDEIPRLFDPFWRGGRRDGAGAGLGLAIAKGIVEAHDGRIWVESRIGGGSAFHFTLPRAPEG